MPTPRPIYLYQNPDDLLDHLDRQERVFLARGFRNGLLIEAAIIAPLIGLWWLLSG